MLLHNKRLMHTVRVDTPDPRFGKLLLEQFGGANGELTAAGARPAAGSAVTAGRRQQEGGNQ